jgi:hypothetical protein
MSRTAHESLDACHGTTSKVHWSGHMTRIYHYVATLEYPCTVGCFHGAAITSGHGGGGGVGGPGRPPGPKRAHPCNQPAPGAPRR